MLHTFLSTTVSSGTIIPYDGNRTILEKNWGKKAEAVFSHLYSNTSEISVVCTRM